MSAFSPPTPLLCVLVCMAACAPAVPRSDLRLAYVTERNLYYCSCVRELRPCALPSPTDCSCKDLPLSVRTRRLTVWYTATQLVARLLNDSEVRHLTLLRCGTPPGPGSGGEGSSPSPPRSYQEGYFAVQHLEQLTLLRLQRRADKGRSSNPDSADPEKYVHRNTDTYTDKGRGDRDTNMDLRSDTDRNQGFIPLSLSQTQDIFLGRERGAAYHEQARLGLIHTSVLEGRTAAKAYTVQTHIDSNGDLPFPNLHLSKLPETSCIYVTFIY